jgi:hypothetical protein
MTLFIIIPVRITNFNCSAHYYISEHDTLHNHPCENHRFQLQCTLLYPRTFHNHPCENHKFYNMYAATKWYFVVCYFSFPLCFVFLFSLYTSLLYYIFSASHKNIWTRNWQRFNSCSVTQYDRWIKNDRWIKKNSMVRVRERTIPTERPQLVGEVIADRGCYVVSVTDPYGHILG